jgi:hypothetical protein
MANEVMAKAHHECYSGIQKLVTDARADRLVANVKDRSGKPERGGVNGSR